MRKSCDEIWMPFIRNRECQSPLRIVVSAKGRDTPEAAASGWHIRPVAGGRRASAPLHCQRDEAANDARHCASNFRAGHSGARALSERSARLAPSLLSEKADIDQMIDCSRRTTQDMN